MSHLNEDQKKINKAYGAGALAMALCSLCLIAFLCFLPDLVSFAGEQADAYSAKEQQREKRLLAISSMNGLDFLKFMTEQEIEKNGIIRLSDLSSYLGGMDAAGADAGSDEKAGETVYNTIRMELPKYATIDDISVDTDLVNHYVTFTIAKANNDYLVDYPMVGEAEEIKSLSFSNRPEGFIMQFGFDQAMECAITPDGTGSFLYIDFYKPSEKYDHIVVIDPGHGEKMAGAVAGEYCEKDINLAVSMFLKELMEERGDGSLGLYFTRTEDVDVSLENRIGMANELDADMFISIHCNSYSMQESVRGTQVLTDKSDTASRPGESMRLAGLLMTNTISAMDTKDMGIIDGSDKYVLRTANVPAALLEIGFMTNNTDLSKMIDEEYQKKCAEGIYDAILQFLEAE